MINKRLVGAIAVSVGLSATAVWFANNWVSSQLGSAQQSSESKEEMVSVVVAALDIAYGQPIEIQHIKIQDIPKRLAPQGTIGEIAEIKGHVAKRVLLPGEIILQSHVAQTAGGSVLSALINENKRAVTVRVNDVVGVGGFLLPGNYVDVLSARKVNKRIRTSTVLRKIKVLAVDQQAKADSTQPVVVRSVTLEVSPLEAERLVTAQSEGTIQLTLRNPEEEVSEKIMANNPKPIKHKQAKVYQPKSESITIIRGVSSENKRVSVM